MPCCGGCSYLSQTAAGLYVGVGLLAWLVRNIADPRLAVMLTTAFATYHGILLIVAAIAWLGSDFDFALGWVSVLVEAGFALAFGYVTCRERAAGGRS